MFGKIISGLIGIFMALAGPLAFVAIGAWAVWQYENNFNGWRFGVQIPFTKCCFIGIPAGIGPADHKEIASLTNALDLANKNVGVLRGAIAGQNASIENWKALADAKEAQLDAAMASLTAARARGLKLEAVIMRPLPIGTECSRYQAADGQFTEALK